jgi:hypothetical protein
MGRTCKFDDSYLRKAVFFPGDFPYKEGILRIFKLNDYYNEEIAFLVSKIRKWDNDKQMLRYHRVEELVDAIITLKGGYRLKGSITESARALLAELALKDLCCELGKWESRYFQFLYAFLVDKEAIQNDKVFLPDKNGRVYVISNGTKRLATKEEYDQYAEMNNPNNPQSKQPVAKMFSEDEWLYLMDYFAGEQFAPTLYDYSTIDTDILVQFVSETYDYIVNNQDNIHKDDNLWTGFRDYTVSRAIDSDLLRRLLQATQEPVSSIEDEDRLHRKVQLIIDNTFLALHVPDVLEEYQRWELLFGNWPDQPTSVDGEHVAKMKKEFYSWSREGTHRITKYTVAQYLYFVLTGIPVVKSKDGGLSTDIACVIDDIMVLFDYRRGEDDETKATARVYKQTNTSDEWIHNKEGKILTQIRKLKRDRVKEYLETDRVTGQYIH